MEATHDLKELLVKLGVVTAFTDQANFSGITESEPLEINKVLQKTFIEVDEKGTVAAAATTLVLCGASMAKPLEFIADHPFAFFVVASVSSSATNTPPSESSLTDSFDSSDDSSNTDDARSVFYNR